MSATHAARATSGPPIFTTSEYVEIDIDPDELEAAGWRYVGKGDEGGPPEQAAIDVVRLWHDEAHDGPWMWCREQPCDTLRGRPNRWDE